MNLLSGIEAFLQVADSGTFVAAARRLDLSPSAVSKLISRTEDELGVRLMNRSTRSISLTAEGLAFLERCRAVMDEVTQAREDLSGMAATPKGRLKVSLPNIIGFFMPVIDGFLSIYPQIALDIDFTDRVVDMVEEGFDVVLRSGDLADSQMMARLAGRYRMGLAANPAYLEARGMPKSVADLAEHDCIQYRFPRTGRIELWPGIPASPDRRHLTCNHGEARMALALQGRGIAFLPDFLSSEHISAGRLISVLPDAVSREGSLHLLWPERRYASPRAKAFIDYFATHLLRATTATG